MEWTTIIVGVDFSPESDRAVAHAMDVARHTGAELELVHVGAVPDRHPHVPKSMKSTADALSQIAADHLAQNRRQLDELRESIHGQGVQVSHSVIDGFPDTGLRDAAARLDASLVAVGTHGRTGIKRFLLGSVAERAVRLCPTSVLVARNDPPKGGYRRVLIATDFTERSDAAIDAALDVAHPDATVDLLHVWQAGGLLEYDLEASVNASIDALGAQQIEKFAGRGHRLTFSSEPGAPISKIEDRLEAGDYDLIALGSHGRRGVRRFLLGSVAEAVVRYAPCSVLVARMSVTADDAAGAIGTDEEE